MSLMKRLSQWLLGPRPLTSAVEPAASSVHRLNVPLPELPPFNLHIAERMRFDPQIRLGLGARNGLVLSAGLDVVGGPPHVARWVAEQWQRIWSTSAQQLLKAKLFGFVPFEVMYRAAPEGEFAGCIEFDRLIDRHPRDTRLLTRAGRTIGFALPQGRREVRVLAPKALVCTFDAEFGNPYGCALLARAYPAWHEKWMAGGAKRTLQLRMIKDAYLGDIVWYPPDRKVTLPGGEAVSWRDVARELVEARVSGGALTLPLMYDRDGRKLVDYTPPQDIGGGGHIFDWKHDVDLELWKALEVPPEVIEAAAPGSGYSGRVIPLLVALGAVQTEFHEIVRCVDRDVLRPLAQLNFGQPPAYELRPHSLSDQLEKMTR